MNVNDTFRSLNVGLPEDILRRKLYGDLRGAIRLIDLRLEQEGLPTGLRRSLTGGWTGERSAGFTWTGNPATLRVSSKRCARRSLILPAGPAYSSMERRACPEFLRRRRD